jgi:hypothetical protein
MVVMFFLVALAASMPKSNLDKICQSAKVGALPGEDQASAYQACMQDERAARDELRQRWTKFSAAARATCAESGQLSFSYVELLTCLEMQAGSEFNRPQKPPDAPSPSPSLRSQEPTDAAGQKP